MIKLDLCSHFLPVLQEPVLRDHFVHRMPPHTASMAKTVPCGTSSQRDEPEGTGSVRKLDFGPQDDSSAAAVDI